MFLFILYLGLYWATCNLKTKQKQLQQITKNRKQRDKYEDLVIMFEHMLAVASFTLWVGLSLTRLFYLAAIHITKGFINSSNN